MAQDFFIDASLGPDVLQDRPGYGERPGNNFMIFFAFRNIAVIGL
jgi:hypothetical protein